MIDCVAKKQAKKGRVAAMHGKSRVIPKRRIVNEQLRGTEIISVTVPRATAREARERTGTRGFSGFVARAMQNELVRMNQRELIDQIVRATGPLDEDEMQSMDRLFGGA